MCYFAERVNFRPSHKPTVEEIMKLNLMMGADGTQSYSGFDHKDPEHSSIIDWFWWAVATMTTVGYGDLVPKTYPGMHLKISL